jgi:transcriptional regulator with XRE-family HTH domain
MPKSTNDETLGERLQRARRRKGLTAVSAAAGLSLNRSRLAQFEADGAVPTLEQLACLARLYSCDFDWLVAPFVPAAEMAS